MSQSVPTSVVVSESVIYQTLKDEIVILNMTDQQYYGLNDVGARMWELLLEFGDIDEVIKRLCATYDVSEATLRADVEGLVSNLLGAGLLKAA